MKNTWLFSIFFLVLWYLGFLFIMNEIFSMLRYNKSSSFLNILIPSLITLVLTVAVIGIGFKRLWARRLYFYISIISLLGIFIDTVYLLAKQDALNYFTFIYGIFLFMPWIGMLVFGIYFLKRPDIRSTFKD